MHIDREEKLIHIAYKHILHKTINMYIAKYEYLSVITKKTLWNVRIYGTARLTTTCTCTLEEIADTILITS